MSLAVNLEFQTQVLVDRVLLPSAISKVAAKKRLHPRHNPAIELASAADGFAGKDHLGAAVITDDGVAFAGITKILEKPPDPLKLRFQVAWKKNSPMPSLLRLRM